MAYGIEIDGVQGIYQVNSTTATTRYLAITHNSSSIYHNGQHKLIDSAGNEPFDDGDIVLARPTSGSGSFCANFLESPPIFNVAASYLVLKPSDSNNLVTNVNGTTYGVIINNSVGNKIFDSRSFTAGVEIDRIIPKGAMEGGDQPYSFEGDFEFDRSANKLVYTSNSTDWDNTYVSVNNGYFDVNWNVEGIGAILNGYNFRDSTDTAGPYTILFQGFIRTAPQALGNLAFANNSTIMAAILKS